MTDMEIPQAALEAAALGIHCRLSIGRGNFIGGQRPTPTSDDLASAALEAALPHLLTEVKSMCETATALGLALGRKEAADLIRQLHKPLPPNVPGSYCPECHVMWPCPTTKDCWRIASPSSQARQPVSNGLTASSRHPGTPGDTKPPQEGTA